MPTKYRDNSLKTAAIVDLLPQQPRPTAGSAGMWAIEWAVGREETQQLRRLSHVIVALSEIGFNDLQFLYLILQGCSLQPEPLCGAALTG